MTGKSGCWNCKNLVWIDGDTSDGFDVDSGWSCAVRDIEHFKTFPSNRLLHCFERLAEARDADK